jgi:uncharacterized protein YceH (UPF0502 family)
VKNLSEIETRIIGALVEKELTTPDYYPLSLNALVNACNQKSNRDPEMKLDDISVSDALRSLDKEGLAGRADSMDGRVTKYEHRLQEAFNFDRRETAVLCELLLRGPQTPGELRSRAERMHHFDDLGQVQATLQRLSQRDPAVVILLQRQHGMKEARYAHLLSGAVRTQEAEQSIRPIANQRGGDSGRITELENEVAKLQSDVSDLKQQFAAFRKQFE